MGESLRCHEEKQRGLSWLPRCVSGADTSHPNNRKTALVGDPGPRSYSRAEENARSFTGPRNDTARKYRRPKVEASPTCQFNQASFPEKKLQIPPLSRQAGIGRDDNL